MIPQHIRKCHRYAISFLSQEIEELKKTLEHHHLLDAEKRLLEKRLKELEADFEELSKYDFI